MDTKARNLIQNDLETTYLVEAGAGTGKTTLLVARILNLVKSGRATLPEIVAITFTEKAADELKTRIRQQLIAQMGEIKNTSVMIRVKQAYSDIEKANINTIHGFCVSILKKYPIEAGLSPDFKVIDPGTFPKFINKHWQNWLVAEIKKENQTLYSLLLLGLSFEKLEKIALLFIHNRNIFHIKNALLQKKVAVEKLRVFLNDKTKILSELLVHCVDQSDKGHLAIEKLSKNQAFLEQLSLEEFRYYLSHGLDVKSGGNQKNWKPPAILKEIKGIFKELKIEVENTRSLSAHNLLCETVEWIKKFLNYIEEKKSIEASVDFEDLLYNTKFLLQRNEAVCSACQNDFRYILIDEFQDTNTLQVEILFLLANSSKNTEEWRKTKLQPGKLFMVGDPKQSIYRFRGADIEIYETIKDLLGESHCLFITRNFRSTHSVINWSNQVFSRIIRKPDDGKYQPEYTALHPSRAGGQIENPIIFIPIKQNDKSTLIEEEAKSIVAMIQKMMREKTIVYKNGLPVPCSYRDIAILFRRYSHVNVYERILSTNNVPYQVVGGKSSYSRIEVQSLLSLLNALLDPSDTISLIATLRSPIFCVSDEEILAQASVGFNYMHHASKNTSLEKIMTLLKHFHLQIGKQSGFLWLRDLFEKTGLLMTFFSMQQGDKQTKILKKILNFAKIRKINTFLELKDFVLWVEELESIENENNHSDDAISIFSIHKSKGLEFNIVILADVAASVRELPSIITNEESETVAIRLHKDLLETDNYQKISEREKQRLVAEEKRLLYVAVTRTRDYLIIPDNGKKTGFLEFLQQDISHSKAEMTRNLIESKTEELSSMFPKRLSEMPLLSESKWYFQRQRWLSSRKKNTDCTNRYISLEKKEAIYKTLRGKFSTTSPDFSSKDIAMFFKSKSEFENATQTLNEIFVLTQNAKKTLIGMPFIFQSNAFLVHGSIDIMLWQEDGLVIIEQLVEKNKDDLYYDNLGTLYAFAMSVLINCMLKEVVFYFLNSSNFYKVNYFNFENISEILQYWTKKKNLTVSDQVP